MARRIVSALASLASCVGIAMLLLVAVLQIGCKRSTEQSTTVVGPNGQKVTVTKNGEAEEISFKGMNGQETHFAGGDKNVALPAGFPTDVAIYPKATVALSSTVNESMTVMLKTADSVDKAKAFYDKSLKENGWKVMGTLDMPGGTTVQATKGEQTLLMLIATEADKTSINITIAKKGK
jgi:hypothetical protein